MRCRTCNHEIPDGAACLLCAATRARPRLVGALLEHHGEGAAGQVHGLRIGRNKLGRDASCDVVLQDSRASGDHAYLFVSSEGVATVTDVSRNGTLVDGRVVQGSNASIAHGSVLQVGTVRLTVLLAPPGEP